MLLGGGINPFPSDNEPDRVGRRSSRYEMRSMDRSPVSQSCIEWVREAECSSLILCDIESNAAMGMARNYLGGCVKGIITVPKCLSNASSLWIDDV